jgi:2-hydroxycyclohexanecarboxyl-CoA dehydrogenase
MRMAGKIAIVTGGGGGIGAATGALFCREGAAVLLFDRNPDLVNDMGARLRAQIAGAKVETYSGDVSVPADAAAAVERAVGAFGGLNVLVNNAAVRNLASVEKSEIEEWQRLYAVNVIGAVNLCKAALPALRREGTGSIINVSSCYALVGRSGMPIYDATKAALLSLTRSLACEEAQNGIRVNAVCPGGTLTPYTVGRAVASGRKAEEMPGDERTDSLLGRWAKPEEVAFPILWLASDESSYMTGATIMVDGGLSII